MTNTLKDFITQVTTEMTNCRYCLTKQNITVDLAKDCYETAQAMLSNFRAIKEEGGFKNDDTRLIDALEKNLVIWADSSKELWDGISGIALVFENCRIK